MCSSSFWRSVLNSDLNSESRTHVQCSYCLQMDLYYYSGFPCRPTEKLEYPRKSKLRVCAVRGYFVVTLQQGRQAVMKAGRWKNRQFFFLSSPDLAKLNPNCQMNYIFICNYLQKRFDSVPQMVIERGGNNSTKMTA